jgi:O-methyltransferase
VTAELRPAGAELLYLDLMKQCLTRSIFPQKYRPLAPGRGALRRLVLDGLLRRTLALRGLDIVKKEVVDRKAIAEGTCWPADAETMIGMRRLDNLQRCVTDVIFRGVPGDLIETGVWRGGASIFMRAILKAYGDTQRKVWLADSFQGLPRPDTSRYPADAGSRLWMAPELAVSLDDVKANFARYGLLDEQVCFLPGFFRHTLPNAAVKQLSILRLDGDLYESTIVALRTLYAKLATGGYVIIDDYGAIPACKKAVHDFREEQGIDDPIQQIDGAGVFWQRLS